MHLFYGFHFIIVQLQYNLLYGFQKRACEHVKQSPNLFAAPQCLGYVNEHGKATPDLCLPPLTTIVRQVKRAVKSVGANTLFVASDHHHMEAELSKALRKMKVGRALRDALLSLLWNNLVLKH